MTPAGLHILLSLAGGETHGYGIKLEVERRTAGALALGPGTLYEAIHRMQRSGWLEACDGPDPRRRPYRLTSEGRRQLRSELERLDEIVRFARASALLSDAP